MAENKQQDREVCQLWLEIAERCAAVFGAPLPKRVLALGDDNRDWGVRLNNSGATLLDDPQLDQFGVAITWNGWPAGVIDPTGGVIAAGDAANEETFRAWLPEAREAVAC